MEFIGILSLILISTTIISHLSQKIAVPAVIGQLLVGIILGKSGFNLVHPDIIVTEFSEIGVILLMFIAGLESNLGLLRKYFRPAVFVAALGVFFPIGMGVLTGRGFNIEMNEAIFLGIALAATSVSISVEVLKELKCLNSKEGSTILGAAIVDDILVVLVASVGIAFLAGGAPVEGGHTSTNLPLTIVEQVLFFGAIIILIRWIAPLLTHYAQKLHTNYAVILTSLIICLNMAYLADFVGLSSVIGAFFAGVAVAQTDVADDVLHSVERIGYSVFIPVFFVSIGLEVMINDFTTQIWLILAFTVVAIISKLAGGYIGAKSAGFSSNASLMIGSGMVSRGEMALIIIQIGLQAHVLSNEHYSAFIIVILLSTLASPLLLKYFTKKVYPSSNKVINDNSLGATPLQH